MDSKQETALINSIKKEAEDQVQEISERAQQVVQERKKSTDEQIAKIQKDHKIREEQQRAAIAQEGERKIASLERKQLLSLKEHIVKDVTSRVQAKFSELPESELKDIMVEWTVEAALGLDDSAPVLSVTASCASFVDENFCLEAARQYKALADTDIKITLSPDIIKKGYGVVLSAGNGKTAYNNLLENRLYRNKDTIEALVLEDIFNE